MTAILLGLVVSPVCFLFVAWVKSRLGYDDSLDVFGVHGIGGIVGAIGTGIVADPALGGQGWLDYTVIPAVAGTYDMAGQLLRQFQAVVLPLLWPGVGPAVLFVAVDRTLCLAFPGGGEA